MADTYSVDPAAHDAARGGGTYPGQQKPSAPDAGLTPEVKPDPKDAAAPVVDVKKPEEKAPVVEEKKPEAEAKKADEAKDGAALDYNGLYTEFSTNGALSDESVAKIKAALPGVTDELISTYLNGRKAEEALGVQAQAQADSEAFAIAGGKDNYAKIQEWAKTNLTEAEINEFNASLERGVDSAKFAISGLTARYVSATGETNTPEPDLGHNARPANGTPALQSRQELKNLIRDPRYAKDAAFRAEVDRKVAAALKNPNYKTY